jgi:endoglucanase
VSINPITRRAFLSLAAAASAATLLPRRALAQTAPCAQLKIPRWRGFNLTEMASGSQGRPFRESDFEMMAEWGFNFARLPLSYWIWSSAKDWTTINPDALQPLDRALELGKQYGIHLCMGFHRIPGYCINGSELEPYQLFDSPRESMQRALNAASLHWRFFADRYKDVPTSRLSFDLLNEPPFMPDQTRYVEIAKTLIASIRSASPDRIIFVNGADIGQTPVLGLIDQGIVQSAHDYQPKMISHYKANWVPPAEFESLEAPTWPMVDKNGVLWNKEKLRVEDITKWKPLTDVGAPVHVGEWGCFAKTPHDVCLAFMADELSLWKEAGWGWSLWNLRGGFGILDSNRADVQYEDYKGHKLDRKMLELILAG